MEFAEGGSLYSGIVTYLQYRWCHTSLIVY